MNRTKETVRLAKHLRRGGGKINANAISDEELIVVKAMLANMGKQLKHVGVKGQKNKIEEMMPEYVLKFEKAIKSGK